MAIRIITTSNQYEYEIEKIKGFLIKIKKANINDYMIINY
ncbi:MAG: hypothetical protein UZ11_BCD004001714 [Bacteroidetes bacterium OLB11]|nr:MAG: hypothetical protein UZ11_BCD004001714 [Bacteroidetes bacterium OLB11]